MFTVQDIVSLEFLTSHVAPLYHLAHIVIIFPIQSAQHTFRWSGNSRTTPQIWSSFNIWGPLYLPILTSFLSFAYMTSRRFVRLADYREPLDLTPRHLYIPHFSHNIYYGIHFKVSCMMTSCIHVFGVEVWLLAFFVKMIII